MGTWLALSLDVYELGFHVAQRIVQLNILCGPMTCGKNVECGENARNMTVTFNEHIRSRGLDVLLDLLPDETNISLWIMAK